jgi:hypothetical protein
VADELLAHTQLSQLAAIELRLPQITVEPKLGSAAELVWRLLQQLTYALAIPGVMVVRSSHSMDVLAPGVTKRAVLDRVKELPGNENSPPVLCIGDRAQWPGNDFCLLSGLYALSVDEVSGEQATGWNLAPLGHRGSQATLHYLRQLRVARGAFRFAAPVEQGRRF